MFKTYFNMNSARDFEIFEYLKSFRMPMKTLVTVACFWYAIELQRLDSVGVMARNEKIYENHEKYQQKCAVMGKPKYRGIELQTNTMMTPVIKKAVEGYPYPHKEYVVHAIWYAKSSLEQLRGDEVKDEKSMDRSIAEFYS